VRTSFDGRAARYEELRPVDDNWWQVFDGLVRLGDLPGSKVLEIGCGTGRFAQALEERALARVWAVDASENMVARAKALGVTARVGRAEALPFKAGWFDAVVMRMSLHLVDRPRALANAARVVRRGGRIAIATEDPESFERVWFTKFFPSVPAVDGARFPRREVVTAELTQAGFGEVEIEPLRQYRTLTREKALDIIGSKAFSTFDLLPREEYAQGLARAGAELPPSFEYQFDWLLVGASR
jgi:SAM-dependent methyltransferase